MNKPATELICYHRLLFTECLHARYCIYANYVMRMNNNEVHVVSKWQPLLCSMWSSVLASE